ncbi:LuxR C-terminal-related transcriptional regulator [Serratia odorifera]|uniref:LuxR C-terminal-related transcriptional regulator n=1 Tax=Serratia odorifera TaxID=618 RepID=UPI003531D30F
MNANNTTRKTIALMDPYPLNLYGLAHFCQQLDEQVEIQLQSNKLHDVFISLKLQPLDVLITDICGMGESVTHGVNTLKMLCQHFPAMPIIVYARQHPREVMQALRQYPQVSLISRDEPLPQAATLFRRALAGETVYSPQFAQMFEQTDGHGPARLEALTQRENDVLMCLFNGLSISQIARLRQRSIKTISAHKCNAMRKLGVKNDSGLFLLRENIVNHHVNSVYLN